MVSADNLNLDCLELIFAFLSGNDLVSVSLVSRSFLASVLPRLYRTLSFGMNQAKRWPSIISPFAAVLSHTTLASHVRHIEVRAVPTVKFVPNPQFMDDCTRTISLCKNLGSFTCTLDMMPNFMLALRDKSSLESIRFVANMTPDQAKMVVQLTGLRALTIDSGSWSIADLLPRWSETLHPTLVSLTLTSLQALNEETMEMVLPNLPLLNSLHVISCPKVDQGAILRLLTYTPQLQSLAFTSYETGRAIPGVVRVLSRLRHLAIDTQCVPTPTASNSTPALWQAVLDHTRGWSCPLKSLSLKLSDKLTLGDAFIAAVVNTHHPHLSHLSLRNCTISKESMMLICRKCTELETLKLSMPTKEVVSQSGFAEALIYARRLHTLTDVGDMHGTHTQRAPIPKNEIRTLMAMQPHLEKVIADGRTWTAVRNSGKGSFELQVKKNGPTLRHWFMPPQGVIQA